MKKFYVVVSNGEKNSRFSMGSKSCKEARRTAEIAHIGSGWHVVSVGEIGKRQAKSKELSINF